jgi:regulatory protein NPR1
VLDKFLEDGMLDGLERFKFLEDDMPDGLDKLYPQKGTPDEQQVKRMRFSELKEDVRKAFSKDKADNSMLSPSSCSPPQKVAKK